MSLVTGDLPLPPIWTSNPPDWLEFFAIVLSQINGE